MILTATVAAVMLDGCSKKSTDDADSLVVTPQTVTFLTAGGKKTIMVTSSSDWNATTTNEWLTITKSTTNSNVFTLAAAENKSDQTRQGKVTVASLSGLIQEVIVAQTGLTPALDINKTSFEVDKDGASYEVTVVANVDWKVSSTADWCTVTKNEDKVAVVFAANPDFVERTCQIKITPVGLSTTELEKTISVTQAAQSYALTIAADGLANKTATVEYDSTKVELTITANAPWTAACSADWVTIATAQQPKTDAAGVKFPIALKVNATDAVRNTEIVFNCGTVKDTIKISQRSSNLYVEADTTNYTVSENETTIKALLRTNGTLSVKTTESWLHGAIAADGKSVSLTVAENTSESRHAFAEITSVKGEVKAQMTIRVYQLARATDLSQNGTANCYIVPQAGTYKLLATVRGNGVSTDMLELYNVKMKPESALQLWATDTTLISNVMLFGDYIYFEANGSEGNAGVAAVGKNAYGESEIQWSWHLWCTSYDIDAEANQYVTPATVFGVPGSVFMGRNLGALANGNEGDDASFIKSIGLEYQWGRKDPFVGPGTLSFDPTNVTEGSSASGNNGSSDAQKTGSLWHMYERNPITGAVLSSKDSTLLTASHIIYIRDIDFDGDGTGDKSENVPAFIQYGISHPDVYMRAASGSAYLWFSSAVLATGVLDPLDVHNGWAYLWGNPNTSTSRIVGKKTIFDPCPAGWQIPASAQWAFVSGHDTDLNGIWGAKAPWKYNHKQAWELYDAGKITLDVATLRAKGSVSSANLKGLGFTKMINMKNGFDVYYTTHATGGLPGDGTDIFPQEVPTERPSGPTMFFPAGGQRSWLGYTIRVGHTAFFQSSDLRSTDATNSYRHYPAGVSLDWTGVQFFQYRGTYEQMAAAVPVRCVKTEIKSLE